MRLALVAPLLAYVAVLSACVEIAAPVAPNVPLDAPTVLALSPANAAVGADPAHPIVITFSHAMMIGMEALVVLHEGSVTGPPVAGVAVWSPDRTVLTYTPQSSLKARTTYRLHLSPSLRSADGQPINLGACTQLGGQFATAGMMGISSGGGMMNGAWGPGMMGEGWRSADGTYGMLFTFTTA
jgi:hypothetical protein